MGQVLLPSVVQNCGNKKAQCGGEDTTQTGVGTVHDAGCAASVTNCRRGTNGGTAGLLVTEARGERLQREKYAHMPTPETMRLITEPQKTASSIASKVVMGLVQTTVPQSGR